jgi:transposase
MGPPVDVLPSRRLRSNRPRGRFVPVKSEETQGAAMVFRVRELLIRQRTQAINASC